MGEKKSKVIVVGDDPYEWVSEDVRDRKSLFDDEEAIGILRPDAWVKAGKNVSLESLIGFCSVLMQLNSAPSQVHPNSWAFIRAFEILMETLEQPPTLGLFFSLFQAKGVNKGVLVNLSGFPGRAVFGLYKDSVDEVMFEFLLSYIEDVEVLAVAELLKWDTDKEAVKEYLAQNLNSTSLKAFFKDRGSGKEAAFVDLERVATSAPTRPLAVSMKRRKIEMAVSGKGKSPERLHGYRGDKDLTSLWGEHYPFMSLADQCSQFPVDITLVNEVGEIGLLLVQVIGARLMCLGRVRELVMIEQEKKRQNAGKLLSIVNEKDKVIANMAVEIKDKEFENGRLRREIEELQTQIKQVKELELKVARLDNCLKSLKRRG
ncbi:hypothetical protein PIB30_063369 [Stylosanthes scabra]|uniref:Uncharacterized protein n=1 Tax=Stylosanthes scabra TaxID=79078 RepID=A0ABU6TN06_9FABA|nr:hypothetical protein [Stylosanthes scabra]